MANTNCLESIQCPRCKSDGPFNIRAEATFLAMTDDGTGEYEDVEWLPDSHISCCACCADGLVEDFTHESTKSGD